MGCLNSKGGGNKGDGATNGDSKTTLANTGTGKAYV
jgi:hypothetical protein